MKTIKKNILLFFLLLAAGLGSIIALVIWVDPFFQYHAPNDRFYYLIDNQLSQNPGMAKNFDYDSVMLGSSMTINFDMRLFRESMDLDTIKLSYNGAYPKDQDNILKIIFKYHPEVQQIFLGIDVMSYSANPEETKYPIPEYLYDDSILNDISYWLNKDVLLDYILKPNVMKESTDPADAYISWPDLVFSKEEALKNYSRREEVTPMIDENTYTDRLVYNMNTYILPYIEAHPDTVFTIFFPPYSILYWDEQIRSGDLDAEFMEYSTIMEMAFQYENVEIYYFQDQYEYITDLDNYTDYFHYNKDMNDMMTYDFADGSFKLTSDNYNVTLKEMKDFVLNYDYESIWE